MSRTGEILAFLHASPDFVSGDYMASQLHVTRTAVWKCLRQLEQMGYTFQKLKGRGYKLEVVPDRLYPWEIERHLKSAYIGQSISYREQIDSTNALAFKLALAGCIEGTCVVAETQSAGRGRLQRKWHSPFAENIYMSVVFRPSLHPSRVYPLTFISSLAAYDTIAAIGLEPQLKWPNDVLIGRKKVCGTLIELSTEADSVRFVIVGMGLNINMTKTEMHEEIKDKATSLFIETKNRFERARICGILLGALEDYYEILRRQGVDEICRLWEERAMIKGKYMEITQMDRVYKGTSRGIDHDGAILLEHDGVVARVIAGDVRI